MQSAIQAFGNVPLACRGAVEIEANVVEAQFAQLVVNNVESGHFPGGEQNRLTIVNACRDDIRDRLRFAGSGRTLDDEIVSGAHGLDDPRLRGVRFGNMKGIGWIFLQPEGLGQDRRPGREFFA